MPIVFANNVSSYIAAPLTASETDNEVVLPAGVGATFPVLGVGDFFYITLAEISLGLEVDWEICKVVGIVNDTLTVQRGMDNTVFRAWPTNTPVELRLTAAGAAFFMQGGPQGEPGLKGDTGDDSIVAGPIGETGPKGDTGANVVIKGSVSTYNNLPNDAVAGDLWIVLDESLMGYVSDGVLDSWAQTGQLQGPVGESGNIILPLANVFANVNTFEGGLVSHATGNTGATRIGLSAGATNQGSNSLAIGKEAGLTDQGASGVIINATGSALNDLTPGHVHIASSLGSLDYTSATGWTATNNGSTVPITGGGSDTAFPGKPANEPIVIVFTGQSNVTGYGTTAASNMVSNPSVYDWREVNGASPQQSFEWKEATPFFASQLNLIAGPFIGMAGKGFGNAESANNPLEPLGNMGWAAANHLQQVTGRSVYMITVHEGAQSIQTWGVDTGVVGYGSNKRVVLEAQVAAALALIPDGAGGTGMSKVDLVIWAQGESNVPNAFSPNLAPYALTAQQWVDAFKAFKLTTESLYTVKDETLWVVTGMSQLYQEVSLAQPYWGAHQLLIENTNQYVTYIPTEEVLSKPLDRAHFTGEGLNEIGLRISKSVLAGIGPKALPYNPPIENSINEEPATDVTHYLGVTAPADITATPSYGDSVYFSSAGTIGPAPLVSGDTFVDYSTAVVGENGVATKFSATSSGNMGECIEAAGDWSRVIFDATKGIKMPNYGTALMNGNPAVVSYPINAASYTATVATREAQGFTWQFEIENEIFATDTVADYARTTVPIFQTNKMFLLRLFTASNAALLGVGSENTMHPTNVDSNNVPVPDGEPIKWKIMDNGGTESSTIETANVAPIPTEAGVAGTFSTITISVQGTNGPNPYQIDVYRNKSLILQVAGTSALVTTNVNCFLGSGNVYGTGLGPDYFRRNYLYLDRATIPKQNLRIAIVGDSNISFNQYQAASSTYHPANNPPLHGFSDNTFIDQVQAQEGTSLYPEQRYWRDETMFSFMEYYLANKNLYPDSSISSQLGIVSYGRSGAASSGIDYESSLNATSGFVERLDAMYGEGTALVVNAQGKYNGPAALTNDKVLDVVVVNFAYNDLLYYINVPSGWSSQSDYYGTAKRLYRESLDRIIKTSKPKVIVVATYQNNVTTDTGVLGNINEIIRSFNGYKNVVVCADVASALSPYLSTAFTPDNVHFNQLGGRIFAEEVVKKITIGLTQTSVDAGDSATYDGINWNVTRSRGVVRGVVNPYAETAISLNVTVDMHTIVLSGFGGNAVLPNVADVSLGQTFKIINAGNSNRTITSVSPLDGKSPTLSRDTSSTFVAGNGVWYVGY